MIKIILLIFLLSSCSFVNEGAIQEKNISVEDFLEKSGSGLWNTLSGKNRTPADGQNYDDLENITLDIESLSDTGSGDIASSDISNTTEDEVKALVDILISSGN